MTTCYNAITSIPSGLLLILKIVITSQPQALLVAEKNVANHRHQIPKKNKNEDPTKMRFHNFHKK
jgi:hypothetical protein